MKSLFLKVLIYSLVIAGILVGVNIWYAKIINQNNSQKNAEAVLVQNYKLILTENRLALMELRKLDSTTKNFYEQNQTLYQKIENSYNTFAGAQINSGHTSRVAELFGRQKELLQKSKEFNQIVKNIYLFDVTTNLAFENSEELTFALLEAAKGLVNINNTLETKFPESDMNPAIADLSNALTSISQSPETFDLAQTNEEFLRLKQKVYDYEMTLLYSSELVELLTTQTNLIIELENAYNKK